MNYDEIFFDAIKRYNDNGQIATKKAIVLSDKEVMLIFWRKMKWEYEVWPIDTEYNKGGE